MNDKQTSIFVIFFLVGSSNGNSNVISLISSQNCKFSIKSIQVKSSNFFIQNFRDFVYSGIVFVRLLILPKFKLSKSLIAE